MFDFHARFYDPQLGRWFTPDPATLGSPYWTEQFSNPYLAMGNNPVMFTYPDGQFIVASAIIIGAMIGSFTGAVAAGYSGASNGQIMASFGVGALAGGLGSSVAASSGTVAGAITGGAVNGSGNEIVSGLFANENVGEIIEGAFSGGFKGAALGGVASFGLYHVASYTNWRSNVKNQDFHGRSIKYGQYLKMQASYTRGKFWGSEKAGGGFWLTEDGISRRGVSYDQSKGNVVKFDYGQKPEGAWATFHPHHYNESQTLYNDVFHSGSPGDMYNVWGEKGPHFSSMIINKYGAELLTSLDANFINFWGSGKSYYLNYYPW